MLHTVTLGTQIDSILQVIRLSAVIVTGGAGFIGCNFIRYLLSNTTFEIVNLDKLTYAGNFESLQDITGNPRYYFKLGGIEDSTLVKSVLQKFQPYAIINFAAESHVDRSIDDPESFIQTNVVGTFRLLEETRHYFNALPDNTRNKFRFLHISTDEVYGSADNNELFSEDNPYRPNSPYSASKASSDHLVRSYFYTYGLPVLSTNCSNNYGPYQFPEKLIPLMILNAVEGKILPVYGNGQNIRDWLFVEDHCRALLSVLSNGVPGQTYNIGGACELTNLQVVEQICDLLDVIKPLNNNATYRQQITFVPDRPGHDFRYAIDISKIKNQLKWEPRVSFTSGLRRTVEWYLQNIKWCQRVQDGSYRRERLGLS